ncbi:hypothetical protein FKM82_026810 [Ascaphus truei]
MALPLSLSSACLLVAAPPPALPILSFCFRPASIPTSRFPRPSRSQRWICPPPCHRVPGCTTASESSGTATRSPREDTAPSKQVRTPLFSRWANPGEWQTTHWLRPWEGSRCNKRVQSTLNITWGGGVLPPGVSGGEPSWVCAVSEII